MKYAFTLILLFAIRLCYGQQYWHPVDGGVGSFNQGVVNALLNDTINDELVVTGTFKTINSGRPDSISCNGVGFWNDTSWSTRAYIPTTGASYNTCLALYNGKVFKGGGYGGVTYLDGNTWKTAGAFDDKVNCLAVYNGKLYAGGDFHYVGSTVAYHIACYDGINWSPVSGGVYWSLATGTVWAMAVCHDKLYVAGAFDYASNDTADVAANNIASWNDTTWSPLRNGTEPSNGYIFALGTFKGNLYVGGRFDYADSLRVNAVAEWDGSQWSALDTGISGIGEVRCFLEKDNSLYVAGAFDNINSLPNSGSVARWDGNSWHGVGDFDISFGGGMVYCLASFHNQVYAAGSFLFQKHKRVNHIMRLLDYPDTTSSSKDVLHVKDIPITLSPNPATSELKISINSLTTGSELWVTDLLGKRILTHPVTGSTHTLNIEALPSGVYLLTLRSREGIYTEKFVKE